MDEIELIQIARQEKGEASMEAFNQIVLKYQDLLYNQAQWLVKDADLAADMTQAALIQAFQRFHTFRGGSLRSWLVRILINTSLDELRRQKAHPHQPLFPENEEGEENENPEWIVDPEQGSEQAFEQMELRAQIQARLQALPEEYREVIILIDLQEFDYAEAAAVLGIPLGTVKSRLGRARQRMRDGLLSLQTPKSSIIGTVWGNDLAGG